MKNITREEALELWLATLEQHPERQTQGKLGTNDNKFCCLGQLCDLLYEKNEISTTTDGELKYGQEGDSMYLPNEVVDFMGFYDWSGIIDEGKSSLAEMNDAGATWPEIAKFIRENPEKVFDI